MLARLADGARSAATSEAKHEAKAALLGGGGLLGLLQQDPNIWFGSGHAETDVVTKLRRERRAARSAKNFARADEIRKELAAMGVTIEDKPDGTDNVIVRERLVETIGTSSSVKSQLSATAQLSDKVDLSN